MIAVDTNIIVRLLTHDDEQQFSITYKLFQENAIFIADTVILETEWVLRYSYEFEANEISRAFISLFGLPNVSLLNASQMAEAIKWHQSGVDFADAMHLSKCQEYKQFYTFDKRFVASAKGNGLCDVVLPSP